MGEMADYYGGELSDILRYDDETEKKARDPQYWVSKNGRVTRIDQMDDRHLLNTLRLLERRGIQHALPLLDEPNELLRETQLKMMGFNNSLTLERYKNMVKDHARRQEALSREETDGADVGDG